MRKLVSVVSAATLVLAACASQQATSPPTAEETFARHCASCHGARGDGTGPVAGAIDGEVPNLTTLTRRHGGEYPADYVASYIDGRALPAAHGSRTMPIWGATFDATARLVDDAESAGPRVAQIVEYLRSLQR